MGLMRFFLTLIEQGPDSIEALGMNGFELHGIDAPLFWSDFEPL